MSDLTWTFSCQGQLYLLEQDTEPHIAHQWGPCDELATCPGSTLPFPWDKAGIGSRPLQSIFLIASLLTSSYLFFVKVGFSVTSITGFHTWPPLQHSRGTYITSQYDSDTSLLIWTPWCFIFQLQISSWWAKSNIVSAANLNCTATLIIQPSFRLGC